MTLKTLRQKTNSPEARNTGNDWTSVFKHHTSIQNKQTNKKMKTPTKHRLGGIGQAVASARAQELTEGWPGREAWTLSPGWVTAPAST